MVDTGALTVHLLRALMQERYGRAEDDLSVTLMSFGFKHGLPDRGRHRARRALPAEPVLRPQPVGAVGRGRGGLRASSWRIRIPARSSTRRKSCCACRSRASGARASRTPRWPSAAPAGATARWRSPRSWGSACARTSRSRSATATSNARAPLDRDWTTIDASTMAASDDNDPCDRARRRHPWRRGAVSARGGRGRSSARSRRRTAVSVAMRGSVRGGRSGRSSRPATDVDHGAGVVILVDIHGSSPFQACLAMLDGTRAGRDRVRHEPAHAAQAGDRRSPRPAPRRAGRAAAATSASARSGSAPS